MKLIPDCVRDILLYLEDNLTFVNGNEFSEIRLQQIQEALAKKYTADEVTYNVYQMHQAKFIGGNIHNHGTHILSLCVITEITFAGHQFLEAVRPETIWQKTKNSLGKAGAFTINNLIQIAQTVSIEVSKEVALKSMGLK